MTDRVNALVVTLENDMRIDDAQGLMDAIAHLKGVASVLGNVSDIDSHIAKTRALYEITNKLWDALRED